MQADVEKRRAARRKKIRRRRLKVAFVFFIIVAVITLAVMCFTIFSPIKHITATGSKIYSKSEIIKASGITTDDNILVISEKKVEECIRKKLPFIDSIELKRNLPDAVELKVIDAKEFACYKTDDGYSIVSEKGYVLCCQSEQPKNVFEIVTSGVMGEVGTPIRYKNTNEKELVATLIASLVQENINIDSIDITNLSKINVSVEGKFTVCFGRDEYLDKKIAHLSGMIDSIGDRKGSIDLSMWSPNNTKGSFVEEKV